MLVRGICIRVSWEAATEAFLNKPKTVNPSIELVDLQKGESVFLEIPLHSELSMLIYPQTRCIFKKANGKYCLNIIQKKLERIPICGRCSLDIPHFKCLIGEPQCLEKEAPKSMKCIKSGLYQNRCTVPRYHYVLVYPENSNAAYLKVGIQRETTFPTRILEQASLVSVVYAKTPNVWKGRFVEAMSTSYLAELEGLIKGGIKVVHVSEKKKVASKLENLIGFMRGISSTLDLFLGKSLKDPVESFVSLGRHVGSFLAERFKEYALNNIIVVNNLEIYPHDEKELSSFREVTYVSLGESGTKVRGKVIGWLGSFLVLVNGSKLTAIDFRRVLGHLVEFHLK